jgi:hypothetical protein
MFGKTKKKIFVSCCSNRNPEWGMSLSLQDAIRETAKQGNDLTFKPRIGESLICRARQNDLVDFMQRGFDYLFSVDDDVFLAPDTITRLLEEDKDVVAGIYRLGQDAPVAAVRLPNDGPSWNDIMKKGLLAPAIYVSTGCMMIRRNVVEGMIEKYPELHYKRNVTGDRAWALYQPFIYKEEYLSEDWAYCQRAKDAGFEVWVHGGVKCGHMKKKLYQFGE